MILEYAKLTDSNILNEYESIERNMGFQGSLLLRYSQNSLFVFSKHSDLDPNEN